MPPRNLKRGGAVSAAGPRKTARPARSASKEQNKEEEGPKIEEKSVVNENPAVEEKQVVEDKPIVEEKLVVEAEAGAGAEPQADGPSSSKRLDSFEYFLIDLDDLTYFMTEEEEVKESVEEYEKDERLELDDNDPMYEPEEYGGVDYDDKEVEQEDTQVVEEVEEEVEEENVVEEEEGDVVEEEEELETEELEGDEDDEHAAEEEEHVETVDAEEEDHHDVFKERRKRKEFEVFVGGLDKDATEEDLRRVFSRVGEVKEVRLMMNAQTKKNKGFAFLRFASVEQAKRAVTELKNPVINGKQCGVTPSQDSDTLFLGNICKTWSKEALREKLKHYGVDNVEDLTLVEDSNSEGMNRGFAFLEFSSRSDAMDAFKRLQKRDVLFGVDRPAKVSFADSFIDPGDEIMSQVKTVFIDGLPASWDEDRVRELLKIYGEIEKIELARNMPSARRKDFGFVIFDTHEAAVTCAKGINNAELGEGDNKAKVRARLSRPLQRGKGKHSSRGDHRSSRGANRVVRGPWVRSVPRTVPSRPSRIASRASAASMKRPAEYRDRRPPVMPVAARARPVVSPRSYDRRAPAPSYPRGSMRRDYSRRDELPPLRSRTGVDYSSRTVPIPERRPSYRDDFSSRGSGYADLPRNTSRTAARRAYEDDGYSQRYERPPPSYREARSRDYDHVSGSKRPYAALDEVPTRYADAGTRHSRARLDYELGPDTSQYREAYSDRMGRSNIGYGGSRNSVSSQDSHGLYSSRQGMGYGGSYGGSDGGGMYPSSYGSEYIPRSSDVGGSSYSSMYSGRGMGSSNYMGSGGSGSYY
ncbi:hypothetical protein Tsubulata_002743 [Turnera subulata]|uniref:RRM domain-containing protein n=1 Tax=Turnera subulata TaxID=218843 RepID=A0A9Q0JMX2_9ROSI|nr:hypothetical protein Tsubulata_002743 [Turnera subulata]